jgi:hypothetical protein
VLRGAIAAQTYIATGSNVSRNHFQRADRTRPKAAQTYIATESNVSRNHNCTVQHLATFNYEWPQHRRLMQRITVGGGVPC